MTSDEKNRLEARPRWKSRSEAVDYWWSGGFPGAFASDLAGSPVESKLRAAFRAVLLAMPDEDFGRFMELSPTIICQPEADGAAFSYHLPVLKPRTKSVVLRVLYFRPDLHKFSETKVTQTVAHETAHLLLGHADLGGHELGAGKVHAEEAAERKAESWGFSGAYGAEHRRQLAREHEVARRNRASSRR